MTFRISKFLALLALLVSWSIVPLQAQDDTPKKSTTKKSTTAANKKKVVPDDDDADSPASKAKPAATPSSTRKKTVPDDDQEPVKPTPAKKKAAPDQEPAPAKTSSTKKKVPEGDAELPLPKKAGTSAKTEEGASPKKPTETGDSEAKAPVKKSTEARESESTAAVEPGPPKSEHAPAAIVEPEKIADFTTQPPRIQQLIRSAIDLTRQNLTYTFGSSDPANGGMDCSGTMYYLLRSAGGFPNVPRDSSSQYLWARKSGAFFPVVGKTAESPEFAELQPGDLMFWTGTYDTGREVPISHVMLYLGREKGTGKRIMFGASDGRSYNGVQRWGVSVFDFKMPKADPANPEKAKVDFVGYARIPGLRTGAAELAEAAPKSSAVETEPTQEAAPEKPASKAAREDAEEKPAAKSPAKSTTKPSATPSKRSRKKTTSS